MGRTIKGRTIKHTMPSGTVVQLDDKADAELLAKLQAQAKAEAAADAK